MEYGATGAPRVPAETSASLQADALASLIQATLTPIIGPLVAELAASRQTNERQAGQLVSQAEAIGELRAENRALRASQQPQAGSGVPEPQELLKEPPPLPDPLPWPLPPRPNVRALAPWLLTVLAIVAAVALLLVPR